jgi:hypothetical protein
MLADADDLEWWNAAADEVDALDETGPVVGPGSPKEKRRDRQEELVDQAPLHKLPDDGGPALAEDALVAATSELGDDGGEIDVVAAAGHHQLCP